MFPHQSAPVNFTHCLDLATRRRGMAGPYSAPLARGYYLGVPHWILDGFQAFEILKPEVNIWPETGQQDNVKRDAS
ncbi:hypothetical protein RRG08_064554 [Elysia crispata]|uniref:Uncharacterized protein n=1 Tax=Elysia crispata TaxID=231223 RepID=A0AAE1ECS8_9GAST|nr:hypothetical protein RRG08_064554 [Elysia crispata]